MKPGNLGLGFQMNQVLSLAVFVLVLSSAAVVAAQTAEVESPKVISPAPDRSDVLAILRRSLLRMPPPPGLIWSPYITDHRLGKGKAFELFEVGQVKDLDSTVMPDAAQGVMTLYICLCPDPDAAQELARRVASGEPSLLPALPGMLTQCVVREGLFVMVARKTATPGFPAEEGGFHEIHRKEVAQACARLEAEARVRNSLRRRGKEPWLELVHQSLEAPRLVEWGKAYSISGRLAYQLQDYSKVVLRVADTASGEIVGSLALPVFKGVREQEFSIPIQTPPEPRGTYCAQLRYRVEAEAESANAVPLRQSAEFSVTYSRLELRAGIRQFRPQLTIATTLMATASLMYGENMREAVNSDLEITFSVGQPTSPELKEYFEGNTVYPENRIPQTFRTDFARADRMIRWDPEAKLPAARLEVPIAPSWKLEEKGYGKLVQSLRAFSADFSAGRPVRLDLTLQVTARASKEGALVMEEKVVTCNTRRGGRQK